MIRALSILAALTLARSALAWNDFGHMTVAEVAWRQLRPVARAEATRLLKLNPDYQEWVSGVPESDRAQVAFLMAARWPDGIKHLPDRYTDDGDRPSDPGAARKAGYADPRMHKDWHFIDLPFSPDGTPVVQPHAPNIQTQIGAFRKAIASASAPDDLKSYDLVWLLHLVGDVHQPLHAISRFDKAHPQGDAGGNLVPLCAAPCTDQLHGFWDGLLGDDLSPMAAARYAESLPPADPKLASAMDESTWVAESFELGKKAVYAPPIGIGTGPFAPDQAYRSVALPLARKRAALAGARLARLLDAALE